jgi:NAD(P)-dependent dehydrogenase (short-subunit alcohol dehydrogenase family)
MVELAAEEFRGLDGAVNAAGIAATPAPIADMPAAEWRRNFEFMLLGVTPCMKYEIAAMLKRPGDSVIPRRSGYFMLKSSMAVLPRIFWAVSTDAASNTAWMASRV